MVLPSLVPRPASYVLGMLQDLCRIKWDPDPDEPPKGFIRGHIPDAIKCKMFELYSQDSDTNSVRVSSKRPRNLYRPWDDDLSHSMLALLRYRRCPIMGSDWLAGRRLT